MASSFNNAPLTTLLNSLSVVRAFLADSCYIRITNTCYMKDILPASLTAWQASQINKLYIDKSFVCTDVIVPSLISSLLKCVTSE